MRHEPGTAIGHRVLRRGVDREVIRVSTLLGRYLVTLLDAGRLGPPVDDEKALAERVASVARGMRARAARREGAPMSAGLGERDPASRPAARRGQDGEPPSCPHEDVVARRPFLAPLVELPGPAWRFHEMPHDVIAGSRACGSYTEAIWVISEFLVGLNRTPIRRGPRRSVSGLDVVGSLAEVVDVLKQPVRWEEP